MNIIMWSNMLIMCLRIFFSCEFRSKLYSLTNHSKFNTSGHYSVIRTCTLDSHQKPVKPAKTNAFI